MSSTTDIGTDNTTYNTTDNTTDNITDNITDNLILIDKLDHSSQAVSSNL